MTRPHDARLLAILKQLARANEPTLAIIEKQLGMTPRNESPDAGKPFSAIVCHECSMTSPCMWNECKHPLIQKEAKP
jgi:hypothetical protein